MQKQEKSFRTENDLAGVHEYSKRVGLTDDAALALACTVLTCRAARIISLDPSASPADRQEARESLREMIAGSPQLERLEAAWSALDAAWKVTGRLGY